MDEAEHEWVHLTAEHLTADALLVRAIEQFQAPPGRAGSAAAAWLKDRALKETSHIATYVLLVAGSVAGFYSLGMSEELTPAANSEAAFGCRSFPRTRPAA